MTAHLPIGINPTVIGVDAAWWVAAARRAEAAGFNTVWAWDHFVSRGDLSDPLLECWTTLTAAAASTDRIHVGSFVANVMNRPPAVLARIVATLADLAPGRVELGIGIGGHPAEHRAYGLDFPPAAERAARLEEAIAVVRLLFSGGPVDFEGQYYRLEGAHAFPAPQPAPRIIVAGMTPAGARLAARHGDAWTCFASEYDRLLPVFEAALGAAGRSPVDVAVVVGIDLEDMDEDIDSLTARWRDRGASELVLHDVGPARLEHILALL
jgi:alkanesulfonate monooxygenase SsuD/methylene tetrahydromethanopterin reductase-like flavin-dependent oxidoreductase (luciferase family)